MLSEIQPWVVVLAAGSGTRLSSLTRDSQGAAVPKQYCSLAGGRTLLEDGLARARRIAAPARITTIVAAQHQRWWQPLLNHLPRENVIEQPHNRGTAVGILLAALHIHHRDPNAVIVFLPSDHFISDEALIGDALRSGLRHLVREPHTLLLLGITPEQADTELGYIVPTSRHDVGVFEVSRFVEKPNRVTARDLLAAGSVWNSFIFAVRASTLFSLCAQHAAVVDLLAAALRSDGWKASGGRHLAAVYDVLNDIDFSRSVLTGNESALRMLPVARCGWTDLGTPERVARCIDQLGARRLGRRASRIGLSSFPDLASAYANLSLAG